MKLIPEYHPDFGLSAPSEGWVPAPRYLLRRTRALALLGQKGGRILDIGCGPGALLKDLQIAGWIAVGLETSSSARAIARKMHAHDEIEIRALADENWQKKFDVVSAFEVVEHIEDEIAALRQWKEWLKPKGKLILSVPAHPILWNVRDVNSGHFRRYRKRDLVSVVEQAGFEVDHVEYYGFPLATVIEIVRFLIFYPIKLQIQKLATVRSTGNSRNQFDKPSLAARTARSGSDRTNLVRYWPYFSSAPVVWVMKIFGAMQTIPLFQKLGNGIIIVATLK